MKIYTVRDITGKKVTALTFKIDQFGKVRIFSPKEVVLEESNRSPRGFKKEVKVSVPKLKKDGTPKKKPGRASRKPFVTPPIIQTVKIDDKIISTQNGITDPITPILDDAETVNVGDKIEFTMNGEPTEGHITKEYPDLQEMEVKIKSGLKVVIPAAWFIRKV